MPVGLMHSFGWYVILPIPPASRSIGFLGILWNSSRRVLPRVWFYHE